MPQVFCQMDFLFFLRAPKCDPPSKIDQNGENFDLAINSQCRSQEVRWTLVIFLTMYHSWLWWNSRPAVYLETLVFHPVITEECILT